MRWLALTMFALAACAHSAAPDNSSAAKPANAAAAHRQSDTRCWKNADCPSGQDCLIPEGAIRGVCGEKVDELGLPDHSVTMPGDTEKTQNCSFDTDCPVSFKCKKLDALHGVCAKR